MNGVHVTIRRRYGNVNWGRAFMHCNVPYIIGKSQAPALKTYVRLYPQSTSTTTSSRPLLLPPLRPMPGNRGQEAQVAHFFRASVSCRKCAPCRKYFGPLVQRTRKPRVVCRYCATFINDQHFSCIYRVTNMIHMLGG